MSTTQKYLKRFFFYTVFPVSKVLDGHGPEPVNVTESLIETKLNLKFKNLTTGYFP